MISFDTNLVVHALNSDSASHESAREFLQMIGQQREVVICELMLVEVFLKLSNSRIFHKPMSPKQAGEYCETLRSNQNWLLVESAPVMDEVWQWTRHRNFAFRRLIDIRLGLTLRYHGVTHFATTNTKDFRGLGFSKVWNPVELKNPLP
jgi:toxin-antitoxin system PIN domain toxin